MTLFLQLRNLLIIIKKTCHLKGKKYGIVPIHVEKVWIIALTAVIEGINP